MLNGKDQVGQCSKYGNFILPVLLQSQSLMHLVGFNGHQVKQGVNRRSLDKSKTDWEDKNNTAIRGPGKGDQGKSP